MARTQQDVAYVFIHPGWRGAWCWDRVLRVMAAWGREAYAVDCPGHGERLDEIEQATLAGYPLAVIELAEYEHRGEGYATEQLWTRSTGL